MSTLQGIGTYAVYKPEFAQGNGKFIKKPENQRYNTDAQRQKIIDTNRRYLNKHKDRLKIFRLYDHPGNALIFQWPPPPDKATTLRLWLLYQPWARQYDRCNGDGVMTIIKAFAKGDSDKRQALFEQLAMYAAVQIEKGYLWQARIYEQPSNEQLFTWSHQEGETWPGGVLEILNYTTFNT